MCILFSIDQQYLQNDIIMEKLMHTLFLIKIKNKTTEIKNSTNQSKKKTVKQNTIYNSHFLQAFNDQASST
jgi:hypothetical protein